MTEDAHPSDASTGAPHTGDPRVDEALAGLAATREPDALGEGDPSGDLDAVLAAGEDVHRRLTSRLSDLGT